MLRKSKSVPGLGVGILEQGELSYMDEQNKSKGQPDKNLASEERPVPSQAEGDRETIEEDLKDKKDMPRKS